MQWRARFSITESFPHYSASSSRTRGPRLQDHKLKYETDITPIKPHSPIRSPQTPLSSLKRCRFMENKTVKNEWVDEWSAEEAAQLSKYEKRLIECARLGQMCSPDEGDEKPELSARLIVAIATGQHNQKTWMLHPWGLFINGFTIPAPLNFNQRTVYKTLQFINCYLPKGAHFTNANIQLLSFDGCTVENGLHAEGVSIEGNLFLGNKFKSNGIIYLRDANITGNLEITDACLNGNGNDALNAEGITIQGNAFLRHDLEAKGKVHLAAATITKRLEIDNAKFSNDIIANYLVVSDIFIFRKLTFEPSSSIDLRYAEVDVLVDDLKSWQKTKKIKIDGFKYNHLNRIERGPALSKWLDKMPATPFTPQPYEQLAKCLKSEGHLGDARMILIEKQNRLRKFGEIGALHKAWLWFTGPLMDFGYRPWKVVLPILIMLVLGWMTFSTDNFQHLIVPAKERILMEQQKPENIGKPVHEWLADYPSFNPIIYSIDTFFPFVDLKQEDYWIPRSKGYLWFHIAMGWFFSFLLVAGLAGLVKKDD
jgi:hypothetical protein